MGFINIKIKIQANVWFKNKSQIQCRQLLGKNKRNARKEQTQSLTPCLFESQGNRL